MDPATSAEEAGLRYVNDDIPGIRRRRAGGGFTYLRPDGRRLTDPASVAWIRGLAIPPAWTDVWICPLRQGHLQATGRDARGRKQYRYHPRWRSSRDELKFGRMIAFGGALRRIRARVDRDLRRPGLPRERVLAVVLRLLEETRLRVGNEEYARDNRSFGLTTLRNRHATVGSRRIRFRFRAKGGATRDVEISDAQLARIVSRCQDLPGQELFAYVDEEGDVRSIGSADVNEYLREVSGQMFTAKDFRTWAGTVQAAAVLSEVGPAESEAAATHNVVGAVERVAEWLGNTPAVARSAYVHPAVIEAYLEGQVVPRAAPSTDPDPARDPAGRARLEANVLALLRERVRRQARTRR